VMPTAAELQGLADELRQLGSLQKTENKAR
jgi:hypothetical protein